MNDLTLQKARAYEAEHGAAISPEERPAYHMTPYVGWLNDPNGFSYYKGKYHQFYQYNPYDVRWAPMHWVTLAAPTCCTGSICPVRLPRIPRQTTAPAASPVLLPRWMTASSC